MFGGHPVRLGGTPHRLRRSHPPDRPRLQLPTPRRRHRTTLRQPRHPPRPHQTRQRLRHLQSTPAYCHAHHIIHWIDGGPTSLNNLALFCGGHHHAIHKGHYTVTITNGTVHVTRPTWADPTPNPPAASTSPNPRHRPHRAVPGSGTTPGLRPHPGPLPPPHPGPLPPPHPVRRPPQRPDPRPHPRPRPHQRGRPHPSPQPRRHPHQAGRPPLPPHRARSAARGATGAAAGARRSVSLFDRHQRRPFLAHPGSRRPPQPLGRKQQRSPWSLGHAARHPVGDWVARRRAATGRRPPRQLPPRPPVTAVATPATLAGSSTADGEGEVHPHCRRHQPTPPGRAAFACHHRRPIRPAEHPSPPSRGASPFG